MVNRNPAISITEYNAALLRLSERSGRELVVMGLAFLDLALEVSVRGQLKAESEAFANDLFDDKESATANTSKQKADLARALGVITPDVHWELGRLRKIRNEYAHSFLDLDVDAKPVDQWIDGLGVWKDPGAAIAPGVGGTQSEFTHPVYLTGPDGAVTELSNHLVLTDSDDRVALYVPHRDKNVEPDRNEILRLSIWALVFDVATPGAVEWVNRGHS